MYHSQLSLRASEGAGLSVQWLRSESVLWRVPVHYGPDAVVVAYDESLSAYVVHRIKSNTGETRWSRTLPVGGYGAPAVTDDCVAVLNDHVGVAILDWDSGRKIGAWRSAARIRSPITTDAGTFIVSAGDSIVCVESDAKAAAKYEILNSTLFGAVVIGDATYISLFACSVAGGQRLGVLSRGRHNWSVDLADGALASSDTSGPILHEGAVYCGLGRKVFALDAASGQLIWSSEVGGIVTRSAPTVLGELILVGDLDGCVTAISVLDGSIAWQSLLTSDGIWAPISVLGEQVVVPAGGQLVALDPVGGERVWALPVGQSPYSALTFGSSGCGVVGGGDPPYYGLLIGVTPSGQGDSGCLVRLGADLWRVDVERGGRQAEPVEVDGSVFGAGLVRCDRQRVVSLPSGRLTHGRYALPVRLRGGAWVTAHLDLGGWPACPKRLSLGTSIASAIDPLHSGAAILTSLLGTGDDDSQRAMRRYVERIVAQSGSQPWDMWRLAARQALHDPPDESG